MPRSRWQPGRWVFGQSAERDGAFPTVSGGPHQTPELPRAAGPQVDTLDSGHGTSRLTSCKPRYNCPVLSCLLASHNHRFPYPSPSSTNHQELISSNTNNNKWYVMFFFLLPCPQLEYNKLIQLFQAPLSTIALVLGSLTAGGGITGFVRTGSIPSVVAGVTVGSLVRCPLRFFLLLSSCPYLSTSYLFQLLANDPALKSICLVASASATTRRTAPSSRCSPQSSSPEAPSLGPSGRGSHCRLD